MSIQGECAFLVCCCPRSSPLSSATTIATTCVKTNVQDPFTSHAGQMHHLCELPLAVHGAGCIGAVTPPLSLRCMANASTLCPSTQEYPVHLHALPWACRCSCPCSSSSWLHAIICGCVTDTLTSRAASSYMLACIAYEVPHLVAPCTWLEDP